MIEEAILSLRNPNSLINHGKLRIKTKIYSHPNLSSNSKFMLDGERK